MIFILLTVQTTTTSFTSDLANPNQSTHTINFRMSVLCQIQASLCSMSNARHFDE